MRYRLSTLIIALLCSVPGAYLICQYILDQQRLTWRDYMEVRDGMTRPEIEGLFGKPQRVEAKPGGVIEVHWFGRKQGMISVEFGEDGAMLRKCFMEDAVDYRLSFFPRVRE
jgi:hypothetical protein